MADDTTTLIRDTYAGCAASKNRLVLHVHGRILRVLRAIRAKYPGVRNEDQTDDLFHEVWIKAVEDKLRIKTFPDYAAFQAYLATTATNLLKDRLKHMKRATGHHVCIAHEQAGRADDAARMSEELASHLDLLDALDDILTPEEARLYKARFVLDLTWEELGVEMGASEATARRKLKEIDAKLRAHLGLADGKERP